MQQYLLLLTLKTESGNWIDEYYLVWGCSEIDAENKLTQKINSGAMGSFISFKIINMTID